MATKQSYPRRPQLQQLSRSPPPRRPSPQPPASLRSRVPSLASLSPADVLAALHSELTSLSIYASQLSTLAATFSSARSPTPLHRSCISEVSALAKTLSLLTASLEECTPFEQARLLAKVERKFPLEEVREALFLMTVLKTILDRTNRRDDRRKRWNMQTRLIWPMEGRQTEMQVMALRDCHAKVLVALQESLACAYGDVDSLQRIPSDMPLTHSLSHTIKSTSTTGSLKLTTPTTTIIDEKEDLYVTTVSLHRLSVSSSETTYASVLPSSSSASSVA